MQTDKKGIDYFPLDVNLDEKFDLLEAACGLDGFAIVLKLYQRIYQNGYFCAWNHSIATRLAYLLHVRVEKLLKTVGIAVENELFDGPLLKRFQILTSRGIQKRYLLITSRRQSIEIYRPYLLLKDNEIPVPARKHLVFVHTKPISVDNSAQSKVKKRKDYYYPGRGPANGRNRPPDLSRTDLAFGRAKQSLPFSVPRARRNHCRFYRRMPPQTRSGPFSIF